MWRRPSEGTLPVSFPWHQSLSLPLPCLRREVLRGVQPRTVFPVNCVCTVPVRPDHPCRLPCSAASFCSSSVDSRDMSVPVGSFSPLAPVHLVCPLQFSQFQAELVDYPDRAAAAYVSNGRHNAFRISFEALSDSLQSASSNICSTFDIMARGRGTDGEVWRGQRLSQCCYSSFGSPAFGNELTGKILRGPGAPVWSLVGSIHFYCYCGYGPVDADLSPRCWLLSSLFRSLSRWVPQPPRCVATICRRVFSCVPNLAFLFTRTSWRARLLTGLSHATGPASRWKERANHYPAESLIGHLPQCVQDSLPPPPPPG